MKSSSSATKLAIKKIKAPIGDENETPEEVHEKCADALRK